MCVIFLKTIYFVLLNVKISFKIYIIQCQLHLFTEVNLKFFGSQSSNSQPRESIVFLESDLTRNETCVSLICVNRTVSLVTFSFDCMFFANETEYSQNGNERKQNL